MSHHEELIARARALLAAATPGPWFASAVLKDEWNFDAVSVGPFELSDPEMDHVEETVASVSGINHPAKGNGDLIAAAPELIEQLCDALTQAAARERQAFEAGWMERQNMSDSEMGILALHAEAKLCREAYARYQQQARSTENP